VVLITQAPNQVLSMGGTLATHLHRSMANSFCTKSLMDLEFGNVRLLGGLDEHTKHLFLRICCLSHSVQKLSLFVARTY
jgi:hypothetical protein